MVSVEPTYFEYNHTNEPLGPILIWERGKITYKAFHLDILGPSELRYDMDAASPNPHVWIETEAAMEFEDAYSD